MAENQPGSKLRQDFSNLKWWWLAFAFLLLLAAGLRYPAYNFGYPYIEHPDEPHFALTAEAYAAQGNARDLGMAGYPPGTVALYQHVYSCFHKPSLPATDIIPKVRLLAITFSLGTVLLLALLGFLLHSPLCGFITALLWAITPYATEYEKLGIAEPFLSFFLTAALFTAVAAWKYRSRTLLSLAYLAGILAVSFKYSAVLILAPVGLIDLFLFYRQHGISKSPVDYIGIIIRCLAVAIFFAWLIFAHGAFDSEGAPEWCWRRHLSFGIPGPARIWHSLILFVKTMSNDIDPAKISVGSAPAPLFPVFAYLISIIGCFGIIRSLSGIKQRFWDLVPVAILTFFLLIWLCGLNFFNPAYRHFFPAIPLFYLLIVTGLCLSGSLFFKIISEKSSPRIAQLAVIAAGSFLLIFAAYEMLLPAYQNLLTRRKPDIRNEISNWMDCSLPRGKYVSTVDCSKLFLKWGGYQGQNTFPCNILLADNQDQLGLNLNVLGKNGISYLIMPLKMYQNMQQNMDFAQNTILLKTFQAEEKYYGRDYAVLAIHPNKPNVDKKYKNTRFHGYDINSLVKSDQRIFQIKLYWQALKTPQVNLQTFIYLTPVGKSEIIDFASGFPLEDQLQRRDSSNWQDPAELIIGRTWQLSIPAELHGKFNLYAGFCGDKIKVDKKTLLTQPNVKLGILELKAAGN